MSAFVPVSRQPPSTRAALVGLPAPSNQPESTWAIAARRGSSPAKERQQLAALSLRTLLRHRLGEAEWRGDRDGGSGVAARELLEQERVQHGRLLERTGFGAGDRLDETQRPDRLEERRRQRRRFVRRPPRRRENGAREVGRRRARNFLILGEREGDHDSKSFFEGLTPACID